LQGSLENFALALSFVFAIEPRIAMTLALPIMHSIQRSPGLLTIAEGT